MKKNNKKKELKNWQMIKVKRIKIMIFKRKAY